MTSAEIEQTKLTATFLNTLGTGSIITAIVAPAVALIFRLQSNAPAFRIVAASAVAWLFVGVALRLFARRVLRRLS